MTQAKHTPTPWGYDGDGFDSVAAQHCGTDGYTIFPLDEDGAACGHICEMSEAEGDEEAEANAAFICKAVNNHESLLAACRAAEAVMGVGKSGNEDSYAAYCLVRKAITKATEGS